MRNETTERATRRLLARLERLEREDAAEEARDEAQRQLLARHLERLRESKTELAENTAV
jgi:hypothetical protein